MITHRAIFDQAWPYTLSVSTGFLVQLITDAQIARLGTPALAAMGVAISAAFLPTAITLGITTAVQRRCTVARNATEMNRAVSSGLAQGLMLALPFIFIYAFFSDAIAGIYTSGSARLFAGQYLRAYAPSFALLSMNQALSGYWLGTLQSRKRLYITLLSAGSVGIANVLLIPKYGVIGGAFGGVIGLSIGFFTSLTFLFMRNSFRWMAPRISEIRDDLKTIAGISLHQISLGLALSAGTMIIGMIGIQALAIASVISTLSLPALYVGIGFGTSSSSFLLRASASGDRLQIINVGKMVLLQVSAVTAFISLSLIVFSHPIRQFFFHDVHVFTQTQIPFTLLSVLVLIDGLCCASQRFLFNSNRGIRTSFTTMSFIQWGTFLPCAWVGVRFLGLSYNGYLILHLIQRGTIAFLLFRMWAKDLPLPRQAVETAE